MLFSIDDEFEDDFDDSFEDDLDENFDDSFGDNEDVSEAPKKKKKSPLFTILILLICVLGGGFALMSSGIISTKPAPAPAETATQAQDEAIEETAEGMDQTSEQEADDAFSELEIEGQEEQAEISEDFMEDQSIEKITEQPEEFDLFADEEEGVEESADDLFADETSMTDVDDIFASEEDDVALEQPVEDTQAEELMFDVQEEQADVAVPATAVTDDVEEMSFDAPEATSSESMSHEKQADVLVAPSQEVLSRLETIEDRVTGLESVSENMVPHTPAEVDPAVLEELRSEVSALQAEIKKLKASKSTEAPVSAPKQETPKKASVAPTEVKTEKPVAWMIKSAQPGKALLSSNGRGVLSVKIGDVLSGVGTIKFIGINDQGLWEVRGTTASVLEPK